MRISVDTPVNSIEIISNAWTGAEPFGNVGQYSLLSVHVFNDDHLDTIVGEKAGEAYSDHAKSQV